MRAAANKLEVLLDYVLFEANTNVNHLLDDRYEDLLSEPEKELRELVRDIEKRATPAMRELPAWRLESRSRWPARSGGRDHRWPIDTPRARPGTEDRTNR